MRLITLLSLTLFFVQGLSAQINSGTIDYLVHREFKLWDGMSIEQKKRMEKMKSEGAFDQTGRVTFTDEAFSYEQLKKEDTGGRRGYGFWMNQENPDVYYTSIKEEMVTDARRIMDRGFILEDKWLKPEWEIPEDQQANMAYTLPSKLAFATSAEGDTLTAYFTETIPLGIGPKGYGGLPGAIVYLKVQNEGVFTEYTMTTMQPNLPDVVVTKPTEGDKISREKFEKIKAKREEAMERRRRGWERGD